MFSPAYIASLLVLIIGVRESSQGLAGGFTDLDVNDQEVKVLATKATTKINAMRNGINYITPVQIVSAKRQVVAGTNTVLELKMQESSCDRNKVSVDQIASSNCQPKKDGKKELVTVAIWQKPWENFEDITIKSSKAI